MCKLNAVIINVLSILLKLVK